jgi:hypothetical protein
MGSELHIETPSLEKGGGLENVSGQYRILLYVGDVIRPSFYRVDLPDCLQSLARTSPKSQARRSRPT